MVNRNTGNTGTRMLGELFFALLVAATARCAMAGPVAGPFYGDGTFYGDQSQGGHCSLDNVPAWRDLPWARGIDVTVAINGPQYENSRACGACIRYRTQNPDCTTCGQRSQYITGEWRYAIVADECTGCGYGALDLAKSGDGRWQFEWEILQCNVGSSGFRYTLVGSNPYYIKLKISNARYGVQGVKMLSNQGWVELERQPDNAFVKYGNTFTMPIKMLITSRFSDTIYDELHLFNFDGSIDGWGQFADKGYDTVWR